MLQILVGFFGKILSDFLSVCGTLSYVWVFLLSSLRFHIVVSDPATESFQKIRGEKFERGQGLSHDAGIRKIL